VSKILIVDDDPDIVEACELMLRSEGHETASASSREDGLRVLREFGPDLLITDVMMEQPDDGIALARQLRNEGFTRPIIMLTGIGKVTGLTYGADEEMAPVDAFFEKPVSVKALLAKVSELLAE